MYIRTKKYNSGRQSVQIVKSERIGGKIKQKVIKHVGSATDERCVEGIQKTAKFILHELESKGATGLFPMELEDLKNYNTKKKEADINVNLKNISEEKRVVRGIQDIYGKLYDDIGFNEVIRNPKRNVGAIKALKQITLARIASPKSKKSSVEILDRDYGIGINLTTVYNMMKKIEDKEIKKIQEISHKYTKNIFDEKLDVLFLDGTTLYFESEKEDDLRKPGYGKEGKPQDGKVLLLLFVTKEGLPVGYELYPGNQYEGHTLEPMIEMIKKQYDIDKIFLSADSGFFNKDNIEYLEKNGHNYILGARIKNLNKKTKEEILNKDGYVVTKRDDDGEVISSYKELEHNGQKLIITYNKNRAEKDKKQREKQVETLKEKVGKDTSVVLGNFGYKKYIKRIGKKIEVDEEKMENEKQRDGLKGIISNNQTKTVEEIIGQYGRLRKVEESFRINKHDLLIRPIFHRTEQKIRAHIAISYMAFTLVRHLEYRMELAGSKISPEKIRTELLHIQGSILLDKSTSKKYFLPSPISGIGEKIYKTCSLKRHNSVFEL